MDGEDQQEGLRRIGEVTSEQLEEVVVGKALAGVVAGIRVKVALGPTKPAAEVPPESLKRKFPGQHLGKSLNDIIEELKGAKGPEKATLQRAKKLLEQWERLLQKPKNE